MPNYQLVRCEIVLGGDSGTTVVRGRANPLTYPELLLAQMMHGDEAVYDIHVVGTCDMTNEEMRERLRFLYRDEFVTEMFPGARPRFPAGDPNLPVCTLPVYVAAPTRPDNPDPKLKPLSAFATTMVPTQTVPVNAHEEVPLTADELAAHVDDEDPPLDEVLLGLAKPRPDMPSVADVPVGQLNQQGNKHNMRSPHRTRDHLPDVDGVDSQRTNNMPVDRAHK